eukprot:650085-Pelagomonas_calceolata.AAC.8
MALVGYFNTAEEAMRARDCAAMVVPAAMLNYPASSYTMGQVLSVERQALPQVRHGSQAWQPVPQVSQATRHGSLCLRLARLPGMAACASG